MSGRRPFDVIEPRGWDSVPVRPGRAVAPDPGAADDDLAGLVEWSDKVRAAAGGILVGALLVGIVFVWIVL